MLVSDEAQRPRNVAWATRAVARRADLVARRAPGAHSLRAHAGV